MKKMNCRVKFPAVVLPFFWFLSTLVALGATTPTIIPLPSQYQTRAGTFTLCPSQPVPGALTPASIKILADAPSRATAQYLAAQLFRSTGFQFQLATNTGGTIVKNAILLTTVGANTNLGAEGYELTVAPDSVFIRAPAQAGLFYGVQSLLQLLPPQILAPRPVSGVAWTAPCVYIYDQPRFSWRGYMLDVARHFLTKDEVRQFIDILALHKLNTLHLHLVDDQGWRVQSLLYPNLNTVGSWRTGMDYGLNPRSTTAFNGAGQYGGFYTQNDIRELVAYALERHITIVPEIEMPSHSSAGLASYPQYGCDTNDVYNMDTINYDVDLYSLGAPGTMTFLKGVLTEIMGLFPSQYIHCGGDEVQSVYDCCDNQWFTDTYDPPQMQALGISTVSSDASVIAYQHWFSTNIAAFLKSNGRTMVGWTEFEAGGTVTNAVLMDWENPKQGAAAGITASNRQYVVVAWETNCYFNYYMYTNGLLSGSAVVPDEPFFEVGYAEAYLPLSVVYSLDPIPAGLATNYDQYILGAEGTAFAEYIPGLKNAEFKALPRMCAMAEVTWTPLASKNYTNFTQRLMTQEQRFDSIGINYDRTNQNVAAVGNWTSPVPTSPTNVSFDISANLTKAGEVDVNFTYTSGNDGLFVYSVTLLVNGNPVDTQTFTTNTGLLSRIPTIYGLPYYVLHLPAYTPGATYTIQASVAGRGGTDSNGTVFICDWN
jgi:hexosaminidase